MSSNDVIKIYSYPPIVEAVVEIRTNHTLKNDEQESVATRLKSRFPEFTKLNEINFEFNQDKQHDIKIDQTGIRLTSSDAADIVMILPQSIVVSRQAPYLGWDTFCENVIYVWKRWHKAIDNKPIVRIGARYVNRIDIQFDDNDQINVNDYLTIYPADSIYIGKSLMTNYLVQFTKQTPYPDWSFNISSQIQQPPPIINMMSLILDIDVYYQKNELFIKNNDNLKDLLMEARKIKNEIFQQSITPKAEKLFN